MLPKQTRRDGLLKIIRSLRSWLIEPIWPMREPWLRRQASLLALLVLSQLVLLLIISVGYAIAVPGYGLPVAHQIGIVLWLLIYGLARLGRTYLAVSLVLPMFPIMLVATVMQGTSLNIPGTLSYMIPSYILAGVFLSTWGLVIYGTAATAVVMLLPLIAPPGEVAYFQVVGPAGAGILAIGLLLIGTVNRDRVERDRQLKIKRAYDSTLEGWARALEIRDKETEGHSRRVADLAVQLARRCGVHGEALESVYRGALLHDIGKLALPDSILSKRGRLTAKEEAVMRAHPQVAVDLLAPADFLRPALDIPAYHHERWDGKGYPSGLKGEEIPLFARIFVVVDTWDALLSDRSYHKRWTQKKAIQHLRQQSGTQFDPEIVDLFLNECINPRWKRGARPATTRTARSRPT